MLYFFDMISIEKTGENLLLNKGNYEDRRTLRKLNVWLRNGFLSPLLTTEVFLRAQIYPSPDKITLDETATTTPYAQQIILAGLRDMTEKDFKDVDSNQVHVENAVGFRWAFNVRSVNRNVSIYPQVRNPYAEYTESGEKLPLIGFYFNGRMNMGIQMALNLKFDGNSGIRAHLQGLRTLQQEWRGASL